MKLINGLKSLQQNHSACVATIGNFDGLHLGHLKILSHLKEKAEALNLPLMVISFEPLPDEYFMSETPARIYSFRDKVQRLSLLGVTHFLCLKFNADLANYSSKDFIEDILINKLQVKYLAVGDDFRFGYKREGGFNLLKKVGESNGMIVEDTPTQTQAGQRISSTRIREMLNNANLDTANQLLGRNYQISGRVRHGDKRGRTINFPTLNMKVADNIALKFGVYAVIVHGLKNGSLKGVANLGNRPTVNGKESRLETHLFDFNDEVYGEYISVEFVQFIRPEFKFESFDELKQQIQIDAEKAKNILL